MIVVMVSPRGGVVGDMDKVSKPKVKNDVIQVDVVEIALRGSRACSSKAIGHFVERDARVTRDPVDMNSSASSAVVVANAQSELLYDPVIAFTRAVVETNRVVNHAAVSVSMDVVGVIICDAKINTYAQSNNFTYVIGGVTNCRSASVNINRVISSGTNDNPRTRRAWVRSRRAISEHISSVRGQPREVGRNHLPGSVFLYLSASRTPHISFVGDFVAWWNSV